MFLSQKENNSNNKEETSRGDGSVLQLTCGGGGYWLHAFVKFHRSIH